jgi:glycosyltransferase involved in cell wall biosynthesis
LLPSSLRPNATGKLGEDSDAWTVEKLQSLLQGSKSERRAYTEVIVVDDGSTDDSRRIISGYGDRVTPVFKENGGQASAFNAGFAASRGDVIIFLDADDYLFTQRSSELLQSGDWAWLSCSTG